MATRTTQTEIPKVPSSLARPLRSVKTNRQGELLDLQASFTRKRQNINFTRLKPYLGEYLPKRSEQLAAKTLLNYEEVENESDSTDQETENRPFYVFRPTSAEIQANKNRSHVSFYENPRVTSAENEETNSLTKCPSYINVPEASEETSFPV